MASLTPIVATGFTGKVSALHTLLALMFHRMHMHMHMHRHTCSHTQRTHSRARRKTWLPYPSRIQYCQPLLNTVSRLIPPSPPTHTPPPPSQPIRPRTRTQCYSIVEIPI
jgi:hypothetical protein